jgi:hypothetical protein
MKISFKDIIDSHNNKIGMCVATGFSLKPYLEMLSLLSKDMKNKYCFLSVNEFESMFDLDADYRVVANSMFTVAKEYERFNNKKNTKLLYADTVDLTDKEFVSKFLKINYLPYDQRHFKHTHCTWGSGVGGRSECCENICEDRVTIQEELQKYTKSNLTYGTGSTVALHMLAFSILMGCKTIYIFGVDLDYSKGYAGGNIVNYDTFTPYLNEILNDFKVIKEMAQNIGVDIYTTSEDSPLTTVFQYKEFKNE